MSIQDWFPLGLTGLIALQSKEISRVFSSTTLQKHQFFGAKTFLWCKSHICTWRLEKPSFDYIYLGKVTSLISNSLSRFVTAFLPRSKCLNFRAAVIFHSDFGAQENKIYDCLHFFPFYLPWNDGTRYHDLSFFIVELQSAFSLSSFSLIKRLFSSHKEYQNGSVKQLNRWDMTHLKINKLVNKFIGTFFNRLFWTQKFGLPNFSGLFPLQKSFCQQLPNEHYPSHVFHK